MLCSCQSTLQMDPLEVPLKPIWGMIYLLLCVHVVVKTSIWKIHVVVLQTSPTKWAKVRAARAARLFFLIQPIISLFSGVVVAVAVVPA